MMLLVAVGAVFLFIPDEQPTQEPAQEEQPAPEERVAPDEAPEPEPEPVPEPEPEPAPEPPDSATILLSGDAAYHCNIGSVNESRSVEGVPPQEYEVAVDTGSYYERVSVYCWKPGSGEGTLGVQIVYDGQVRQEATTSAEHGNVNMSWTLQD